MAKNKIIWLSIVFIILVLTVKTFKDGIKLFWSLKKIEEIKQEISRLEKENKEMFVKEKYFSSEEFIEEEARNKLNMARPGEAVVILPPDFQEKLKQSGQSFSQTPSLSNWKKWWRLFF